LSEEGKEGGAFRKRGEKEEPPFIMKKGIVQVQGGERRGEIPWGGEFSREKKKKRIPNVLTGGDGSIPWEEERLTPTPRSIQG